MEKKVAKVEIDKRIHYFSLNKYIVFAVGSYERENATEKSIVQGKLLSWLDQIAFKNGEEPSKAYAMPLEMADIILNGLGKTIQNLEKIDDNKAKNHNIMFRIYLGEPVESAEKTENKWGFGNFGGFDNNKKKDKKITWSFGNFEVTDKNLFDKFRKEVEIYQILIES